MSHALAHVAVEKGSINPIPAASPVVVRLMVPARKVPLNVGGIHEREPVVVAVAWQHIDHRVRLDKPLSHGGEDRPLILVDPTPVGPTSECWVDQVAALVMPQSEVGVEQASRLELLEKVHNSLSHSDVALRKPVGVEKDAECWRIMGTSSVGLSPFAIAREIHSGRWSFRSRWRRGCRFRCRALKGAVVPDGVPVSIADVRAGISPPPGRRHSRFRRTVC